MYQYYTPTLNELKSRISELKERLRNVNTQLDNLEKGSYRGGEVTLSFATKSTHDCPYSTHKLLWNTKGFRKLFGRTTVSDTHIDFYETGEQIPIDKMTMDEDAEPILNALKKYLERTKIRLEKRLKEYREQIKERVEEL